jgi:hypothetical protein
VVGFDIDLYEFLIELFTVSNYFAFKYGFEISIVEVFDIWFSPYLIWTLLNFEIVLLFWRFYLYLPLLSTTLWLDIDLVILPLILEFIRDDLPFTLFGWV